MTWTVASRHAQAAQAVFLAAMLCVVPAGAEAHIVKGEGVSFFSGFEHPLAGWDHIIAMVSVGIWGAQLGAPAIWVLPVTFPLVMAAGGFLALIGVHLPGDEIGIALSGVCLGAVVLAAYRARLWAAASLVGLFGLCHGYAHGAELPAGQSAALYSAGFILATGLLHASGILIGSIHRWAWGQTALRVLGGTAMLLGLFFLRDALA